jgi:hypothetical protein
VSCPLNEKGYDLHGRRNGYESCPCLHEKCYDRERWNECESCLCLESCYDRERRIEYESCLCLNEKGYDRDLCCEHRCCLWQGLNEKGNDQGKLHEWLDQGKLHEWLLG